MEHLLLGIAQQLLRHHRWIQKEYSCTTIDRHNLEIARVGQLEALGSLYHEGNDSSRKYLLCHILHLNFLGRLSTIKENDGNTGFLRRDIRLVLLLLIFVVLDNDRLRNPIQTNEKGRNKK